MGKNGHKIGQDGLRIAVLASGRGSNFEAIAKAVKSGKCNARILALISDNADAPALNLALKFGIPAFCVDRSNYKSNAEYEKELLDVLKEVGADLIVLAGYMRLIKSNELLSVYKDRIINIHPSLLPKYPGLDAQKQAFDAGEKIAGLTIHIVDQSLDGGRILHQVKVDISDCKTAEQAAHKILSSEHIAYPTVIDQISKGKIKLA